MPENKIDVEGVWAPGDATGRSEVRQNDGRVIVARAGETTKLPYPEALWWSQGRMGARGFAINGQEAPASPVEAPPAAETPAPDPTPPPEPSPPQTPLWVEDGFLITADGSAIETP
jgi:hypothetical protein